MDETEVKSESDPNNDAGILLPEKPVRLSHWILNVVEQVAHHVSLIFTRNNSKNGRRSSGVKCELILRNGVSKLGVLQNSSDTELRMTPYEFKFQIIPINFNYHR